MLVLAGVAFAVGAALGASNAGSPAYALAHGFVAAWTKGDYAAMYRLLDAPSKQRISESRFVAEYRAERDRSSDVVMTGSPPNG